MAIAAFNVMKCTGSSAGTEADSSRNPCFLSVDQNSTATSTYPVAIPDSGTNYSYENWLRLKCTVAPDNQCTNFKVFGEASQPATGITLYMGTTDTGLTPSDDTTNHASLTGWARVDTNYYDASNYLSIGTAQSPDVIDSINDETDYIVIQMYVGTTATNGTVPTMHFFCQYDES